MHLNNELSLVPIEGLVPYARNSRTHSDAQVAQIAASIKEFGFTNPVLIDADGGIIAGHGRVLAARKLGLEQVPAIRLDYMTEAQRRAYVIADNKLALNAGWDDELLALELGELRDAGFDLGLTGFDDDELAAIFLEETDDNPYTRKIEAPIYTPSGEKPALADLYDDAKTAELLAQIDRSTVPDDVKAFLRLAAYRHTVFTFSKIADFYAHSDPEIQDLMEKSALVIIDYQKAIENGFVSLAKNVQDQYAKDYPVDEAD